MEGVWPASRFVEFAAGPEQDVSTENLDNLASGNATVIRKAAKSIINARECEQIQHLITVGLQAEGPEGMGKQAAMVSRRGGMGSRGAWWSSLAGNGSGEGYFPSAHFVLMLRHHLLAPLLNSRGEKVVKCVSCQQDGRHPVDIRHSFSHAMHCPHTGTFTVRHNDIRDLLFNALFRGIEPTEGAVPVILLEGAAAIHATDGSDEMVKVDISFAIGGTTK